MIPSVVRPKFQWLVNTPKGPRSELAPGDGVISGIVSWGYMRSNRVANKNAHLKFPHMRNVCVEISFLRRVNFTVQMLFTIP